ncbi:Uncharacterised protein [uncultured Clostridium sp.]|uniref:Uncharacterized protein n=1 Tax=Paeniclostridium hominis TaxID=2764329 RepID=A0ABR7K341_9FIRM|nr:MULTISPECIES: hypothetical protein [Paeniclostridium]MDU1540646.1 hypothetical protein [Paeniclostridium sordellii]SCI72110.1 Uncharacterised protein [uncultured Clostridium sp.]MBC6003523.1 hypothetical protein [Paeniclostridium hominis]MBC8632370.1 hypothetical protein [[Eubacterium] tenue]SCI85915.1 Uncharacterised protein [uncultured Clostridium sp.]
MRISSKKSKKVQPRKRVNKTKNKNKIKETSNEEVVPNEDVILNEIIDKEDKEVEIVLNDLVPEREKENYGMKKNSKNKTKKGGIKLNMNLFPKSKKSTNSSKNHKDNDVIRSEQIANIKEEETLEEINNSEE